MVEMTDFLLYKEHVLYKTRNVSPPPSLPLPTFPHDRAVQQLHQYTRDPEHNQRRPPVCQDSPPVVRRWEGEDEAWKGGRVDGQRKCVCMVSMGGSD